MANASFGDIAAMYPKVSTAGVGDNSWLHEITFNNFSIPPLLTTIWAIYKNKNV